MDIGALLLSYMLVIVKIMSVAINGPSHVHSFIPSLSLPLDLLLVSEWWVIRDYSNVPFVKNRLLCTMMTLSNWTS